MAHERALRRLPQLRKTGWLVILGVAVILVSVYGVVDKKRWGISGSEPLPESLNSKGKMWRGRWAPGASDLGSAGNQHYLIMVKGFGRTGTSFLHRMLNATCDNCATMHNFGCKGEGHHNQHVYPRTRTPGRLATCAQVTPEGLKALVNGSFDSNHPSTVQQAQYIQTCPRITDLYRQQSSKVYQSWSKCWDTRRFRVLLEKTPDFMVAPPDAAWGGTGRLIFIVLIRHPLKETFFFRKNQAAMIELWERTHRYVLWEAGEMVAPVVYVRFEDLTMNPYGTLRFLWDVAHSQECGWPKQPSSDLAHLRQQQQKQNHAQADPHHNPSHKARRQLKLRGDADNLLHEEKKPDGSEYLISDYMRDASAACAAQPECVATAHSPAVQLIAQQFFYEDDLLDLDRAIGKGERSSVRAYCAKTQTWLHPDTIHTEYARDFASYSGAHRP